MLCFTSIVLQTKLDAQCAKLKMIVNWTNFTTMCHSKPFISPECGLKFQREVPLFLDIPEFPSNTTNDWQISWNKTSLRWTEIKQIWKDLALDTTLLCRFTINSPQWQFSTATPLPQHYTERTVNASPQITPVLQFCLCRQLNIMCNSKCNRWHVKHSLKVKTSFLKNLQINVHYWTFTCLHCAMYWWHISQSVCTTWIVRIGLYHILPYSHNLVSVYWLLLKLLLLAASFAWMRW